MKRLGQQTNAQARRRATRGILSGGWIDVILEPLERRVMMTAVAVDVLPVTGWYNPQPADTVSHLPRNIDGSTDATDGLIGFATRINEDNKKTFSDELASFTDDQGGTATDFAATINWGDGTTDAGEVIANSKGGFDVVGTHSYAFGWHGIKITVTDWRDAARSTVVESLAYIIPPPLAARGTTIDAVAGHTFSGKIATFVGLDTDQLDRYTVNVNWADGGWDTASLKVIDNGVVQVVDKHSFIRPGAFDLTITLSENIGGPPFYLVDPKKFSTGNIGVAVDWMRPYSYGTSEQEARTRATVAPGELDGDIATLDLTDGVPFNGTIAHFTSPTDVSHYTALIETSDSKDALAGTIVSAGDGFDVRVDHTFLVNWQQINVRIVDDRLTGSEAQVGLATGSVNVSSHLDLKIRDFSVTTNQEFYGRLGTLTSAGAENWNSTWKVSIDWGDGSPQSDGQLIANTSGGYDVVGRHAYGMENYRHQVNINVDITETRKPKLATLGTPTESYFVRENSYSSNGPGSAVNVLPSTEDVFGLEEMSTYLWEIGSGESTSVAQLTASEADATGAGFIGVVTWEDGSTSPTEISWLNDGLFDVSVLPPFGNSGHYEGTLSISSGGVTRQVGVEVVAHEAYQQSVPSTPLAEVEMSRIDASKGLEWSGVVGSFKLLEDIDRDKLRIVIQWGDGESSDGTITLQSDGSYAVSGSHSYEREMDSETSFAEASIEVSDGEKISFAHNAIRVSIDPNLINADGECKEARQLEEFEAVLAKFTSPIKGATADQFAVTIDWGDGTTSAGEVTEGYKHKFEVSGTHEYRRDGFFSPKVTITGPGGTMSTHASVSVIHHPVEVTAGANPSNEGFSVAGVMATFVDSDGESKDPDSYRVYHAALIDWGDGTITQGTISANDHGGFDVSGSHTYVAAGDYAMKVIVRRNERTLPSSEPNFVNYDGGVEYALASASLQINNTGEEFESPTMILRMGRKLDSPINAGAEVASQSTLPPKSTSQASLFALSGHHDDSLITRVNEKRHDFGDVDDDSATELLN